MTLCLAAVWQELRRRFAVREQSDIARTRTVAGLLGGEGCVVRRLLAYFGEELGRDCGHCGRWSGDPAVALERESTEFSPPADELAELRSGHPRALGGARQMARFFCGISSPALSTAKLTRHPRFGSATDAPFGQVLDSVKRALTSK